jgi:ferredoxin
VKVDPLPPGTTDINTLEAGWSYIDQAKLVVYGALTGSDSNGNGILDSEEGTDPPADMDQAEIRITSEAKGFRNEIISAQGADKLMHCYQCGTCTGSCPSAPRSTYRIRQFMRRAVLGLENEH